MALTSVNSVSPSAPKPSALENAAKVLGIVGSVASTMGSFAGKSPNAPNANPSAPMSPPTSNIYTGQSEAIAGGGGASMGAQIPTADPLTGKPAGFQTPTKPQAPFGNLMGMR